jgi:RecA/RadA recombinase
MAKQQYIPKAKPFKGDHTNFKDINDFLETISPNGSLLRDFKEIEVKDWIHTGSYLFNAQISGSLFGGYPAGKITLIAGDPKTGKSYLTLNGMHFAQLKDYFLIFFETENSPDVVRLKNQLIDFEQCRIIQPETVNEITTFLVGLTESFKATVAQGKTPPKVMVIIDSQSGLLSDKQLKDAQAKAMKTDMGTQAKELKLMYNFASKRLGKYGIPMIVTSHIYERDSETNSQFKERVVSGGQGAVYFSSYIGGLRKRVERDDETKEKVAIIVTCQTIESRFSRLKDIYLRIPFYAPMNEFLGLEHFLSVERCGIGRGKFVEFFDPLKEFSAKSKISQDDASKMVFSVDELAKVVNKEKKEYIIPNLQKAFALELVFPIGSDQIDGKSKFAFTQKCLDRFEDGKYNTEYPELSIAIPNSTSPNYVVEHLGKTVPLSKLFTKEVFTMDVLKKLDPYVQEVFKFQPNDKLAENVLGLSGEDEMSEEELDFGISDIIKNAKKG